MKDDKFSNIFEHAAKKVAKKKDPVVQTPFQPVGNKELEEMFKKVYAIKDEVEAKINKLSELSGMSRQEIEIYLGNPNNFAPHIWTKIEREKKAVEDKLYADLGIGAKETRAKKLKEKQEKNRSGKTLGARKKWLQM